MHIDLDDFQNELQKARKAMTKFAQEIQRIYSSENIPANPTVSVRSVNGFSTLRVDFQIDEDIKNSADSRDHTLIHVGSVEIPLPSSKPDETCRDTYKFVIKNCPVLTGQKEISNSYKEDWSFQEKKKG